MRADRKGRGGHVVRRRAVVGVIAALVALCAPTAIAAARAQPQTAGAVQRQIVFTETVASITGTGPVCDSSGVCIIVATGTGLRSTGDFVGTDGIARMSVRITPHGSVEAGLSTLVGTLTGCGRGTMAITASGVHDSTAPNGGSGRWWVVPRASTGDFVHLTGGGTIRFLPATDGGHGASVLQGTITC